MTPMFLFGIIFVLNWRQKFVLKLFSSLEFLFLSEIMDTSDEKMDSKILMPQKFLEHFRKIADGFIERFEYDSAIFICEKLIRLSKFEDDYFEDIQRLCFCFYQLGEYHRVISIIKPKIHVHIHYGCFCLLLRSYVSDRVSSFLLLILYMVLSFFS